MRSLLSENETYYNAELGKSQQKNASLSIFGEMDIVLEGVRLVSDKSSKKKADILNISRKQGIYFFAAT